MIIQIGTMTYVQPHNFHAQMGRDSNYFVVTLFKQDLRLHHWDPSYKQWCQNIQTVCVNNVPSTEYNMDNEHKNTRRANFGNCYTLIGGHIFGSLLNEID